MANKDAPIALRPFYQLGDLVGMGATGAYGALSDVTGFGADLFGLDDLAGSLYDVADEHYKKAGQFYDDLSNTYTDEELSFLTEPLPRPQLGIDTSRFNKLVPEHIRNELSGRGPFDSPHSRAVSASKRAEAESDDYLTVPTGDELDEAQELSDIEKLISFAQGPKDRGALGRQKRASAQARADQAIDNKMNADAAAAVAKPAGDAATAEQMFMAGMEDFLSGIRGAGPNVPKARSLEDYKKEFADATGLDISGDVDKSQALMAFGLALMQNKAKGKGIGGMLDALGAAGTAAMPALSEARKEARANAAAAGKYALEMRSADQAKREAAAEKSLQRQNYFVVPRSEDMTGFLANVGEGKGRLESLNAYELNALMNDPEFAKKYDILPSSYHDTIISEALKTPEAKEEWGDKIVSRNLITEIDDPLFKIDVSYGKPGTRQEGRAVVRDMGQVDAAYEALGRAHDDLMKTKQEFIELGILTGKERNVFTYGLDKVDSMARALGIELSEGATETSKIKTILTRIQAKNAAAILGEAGKTISDGDRALVAEIVSDLNAGSDIREVRDKVERLFNDIFTNSEANIRQGLANLNRLSGRDVQYGSNGETPLSEEERAEREEGLAGLGIKK